MVSSSTPFSPFTLIRWALFGKRLDEILSGFEKMQAQLDACGRRHTVRSAKKNSKAQRLKLQSMVHDGHAVKAALVRDNLKTLTTTHINPTASART